MPHIYPDTTDDVATTLEERTASPVQERQDSGVDAAVYVAAAGRADADANAVLAPYF